MNLNAFVKTFYLLVFVVLTLSCSNKDEETVPVKTESDLVINSYNPSSGLVDTLVTISVSDFDSDIEYKVFFGDLQTPIIDVLPDAIKVKVPMDAVTSELRIDYRDQSVIAGSFEVLLAPLEINSYEPVSGLVDDLVTINVSNLNLDVIYEVFFGDIQAIIAETLPESITVNVPVGAITSELRIDYSDQSIIAGLFEVLLPPLVVIDYSPKFAIVNSTDTVVEIEVANTNPSIEYSVFFGTIEATILDVTENSIVVQAPSNIETSDLTIRDENTSFLVGVFEVIPESSNFYILENSEYCSAPGKLYEFDILTGHLISHQDIGTGGCDRSVYSTKFHSNSRQFSAYYSGFLDPVGASIVYGFVGSSRFSYDVSDTNERTYFACISGDNFFYSGRRLLDPLDPFGELVYDLRYINSLTFEDNLVHRFETDQFVFDFQKSGFIPSSNTFFALMESGSGGKLFFNLNTLTHEILTFPIPNLEYEEVIVTNSGRILVTAITGQNQYDLLEISGVNGEVINTIGNYNRLRKLEFHIESSSLYGFDLDDNRRPVIQKVNIDNGSSVIIPINFGSILHPLYLGPFSSRSDLIIDNY